jgi:hypothetical protein
MGKCFIESKNDKEYYLKFADCLDDIHLKHLYVLCIQLVEVYISKEVINLHECIPYPFWAINPIKLV